MRRRMMISLTLTLKFDVVTFIVVVVVLEASVKSV